MGFDVPVECLHQGSSVCRSAFHRIRLQSRRTVWDRQLASAGVFQGGQQITKRFHLRGHFLAEPDLERLLHSDKKLGSA